MKQVFPLWVFVVVAALIAITAFGIAQVAKGSGAIVVLGVMAMWMTFVQVRARRVSDG